MTGSALRVVCFSPYPAEGPSVQQRIMALAPTWEKNGVHLTLWPLMSSRLYAIRRRFGLRHTVEKLFWMAVGTALLLPRLLLSLQFDAVIIHREVFPLGPPWLELLLCRLHPRVYFDFDDALWEPPSNSINQRKWLWSPDRVARTLAACRHAVAGNEYLAAYARPHARSVSIVPTGYCDLQPPPRAPRTTPPVIVWIGNLGNAEYLAMLQPVFARLAQRHRYRLRLIGGEDIEQIRPHGVEVEYCRWSREREAEWLLDADIGIMPLPDAPYERGKCGFKLIQYWSAGLPVVASPVGVNAQLLRTGDNGLLAADTDEWERALEVLLLSPELRTRVGAAGRATFLAGFSRQICAGHWLFLFAEALPAGLAPGSEPR